MVVGGGFATNHFLRMAGHKYDLPATSDIDFFLYGAVPPRYNPEVDEVTRMANSHLARAYGTMAVAEFEKVVEPAGYIPIHHPHENLTYEIEQTESGDRIFTSGSKARMICHYYGRYEGGVLKNILNLVFSDMPVSEITRKVDISLTAGFIYAQYNNVASLVYEHHAPQDIIRKRLRWMEPEATRTHRQETRWAKYKARYNILAELRMTTDEFIATYDDLLDANDITLVGAPDQLYGKAVSRRILGLPLSTFHFEESVAPLRIRTPPLILNPEDYDSDDEAQITLSPIEWGGEDSC
jgi:hypothetical protein